jgi:hypothetical protein
MVTQQWPDAPEETEKKIMLTLGVKDVVQVLYGSGGRVGGTCLGCDASGTLTNARHGYPYGSEKGKKDIGELTHKQDCPMNAHLNDDGSLRK